MIASEIKALVTCLITAALSVLFITLLDSVTGVSFNYAVPIALIAALFPFVVIHRWRSIQHVDRCQEKYPRPQAGTISGRPLTRSMRRSSVHSIVTSITRRASS